MRAPEEAGPGTARARLSFAAWKEGKVAAADVEVPIVEPTTKAPVRPVSPLLRATLKTGDTNVVWSLDYSPDGSRLLAVTIPGRARVWDTHTGQEKVTLEAKPGSVYGAVLLPDGKTLATAHYLASQRRDRVDGKLVLLTDLKGEVRLWDLATRKPKRTLAHDPPRGATRLVLSPDGKTLVTTDFFSIEGGQKADSTLSLWDVGTGKLRGVLPGGSLVAFGGDSRTLAVAGLGVRLVDVIDRKEVGTLPKEKETLSINSLAFAADGRTVAGSSYQGDLYFWDAKKRTRLGLERLGRGQRIMALAFSPDSRTLALAIQPLPLRMIFSRDEIEPPRLELWDVATRKKRTTLVAPPGPVHVLSYSRDGKTLAVGRAGEVQLWDTTRP